MLKNDRSVLIFTSQGCELKLLDIEVFTHCVTFSVHFVLYTAIPISGKEAVEQVVKSVREFVGPVAFFKTAVIVPSLPKVRTELSINTNTVPDSTSFCLLLFTDYYSDVSRYVTNCY